MMIKEILVAEPQKLNSILIATIKTTKKKWQIANNAFTAGSGLWMQQVVLTDQTGDILADIFIQKNIPLIRTSQIKITSGEIRKGEKGNILYVDQFIIPTMTADEYEEEMAAMEAKWDKEIDGKIRHGLTCSLIKGNGSIDITQADKKKINDLVIFIKTGEVK